MPDHPRPERSHQPREPSTQHSSRWAAVACLSGSLSAPSGWLLSDVATQRAAAISHGSIYDPEANKNLSSWSKQLISLLGCLGSCNVIIIPTQALANVRLIPTAATDTIIKAPGFLCSEPCTDEARKVCFGGKTKHELYFFSTPLLPASFLPPSLWRSERSCQNVPPAAGNRARAEGL